MDTILAGSDYFSVLVLSLQQRELPRLPRTSRTPLSDALPMLIEQDDQVVSMYGVCHYTADYLLYREFVRHNSSSAFYATD